MTFQVQFLELELDNFLQFSGSQKFSFASRATGGQNGLTLLIGGGASGKTNLAMALRLVLWGEDGLSPFQREYLSRIVPPDDVHAQARRYINAAALSDPISRARVRLTIQLERPSGEQTTIAVTRSWHVTTSGVKEYLRSKVLAEGAATCLNHEAVQAYISALLPRGRSEHLFSDAEHAASLGFLAFSRPPLRREAHRHLEWLAHDFPVESWRDVAPAVIGVANRLLMCDAGAGAPFLLPEDATGRWPGSHPVVPGVWISREPESGEQTDIIGSALAVGLHLTGRTRAPLVLDAPTMRMRPKVRTLFLEALSRVDCPQIVVLDHKDHVDDLVVHLWEHARRIYLVESLRPVGTRLLNADG